MNNLSIQFAKDMQKAELFIDMVNATFKLAKGDIRYFRSKHQIAADVVAIHKKTRELGTSLEALDGTYLSICAQYEFVTRNLIETFINKLNNKIPLYSNLPEPIRDWYPRGCANLILNSSDKYPNITQTLLLNSIASCMKCSIKQPYHLVPEAFSYHDNNLRSDIILDLFQTRLGIEKVWQKLGRQKILTDYLHSSNAPTTEQLARKKLDTTIVQRNNIIHRGQSFTHPGESVVHDTAQFFGVFVEGLSDILIKYLASI